MKASNSMTPVSNHVSCPAWMRGTEESALDGLRNENFDRRHSLVLPIGIG